MPHEEKIAVGTGEIASLFVGSTGIKSALVGSDSVYERPGAFVYIQLKTTETMKGD